MECEVTNSDFAFFDVCRGTDVVLCAISGLRSEVADAELFNDRSVCRVYTKYKY